MGNIYAYSNFNTSIKQIEKASDARQVLNGRDIDRIFRLEMYKDQLEKRQRAQGTKDPAEALYKVASRGDIVITSSLINFSKDFTVAIGVVKKLDDKDARVIAILEGFDSESKDGQALISAYPIMRRFHQTGSESRKIRQREGIEAGKIKGVYKGRKSIKISDFEDFPALYERYMQREFGKKSFAEKLGVSRPTLDRLIVEYKAND